MKTNKIIIAAMAMSVVLFSCSSNKDFAKVKYLDKTFAKKTKKLHTPEKRSNESAVNDKEAHYTSKNTEQEMILSSVANEAEKTEAGHDELLVADASNNNEIYAIPGYTNEQIKKQVEEVAVISLEEIYNNSIRVEPAKVIIPVNTSSSNTLGDLILVILAFLIPPLAVFLKRGLDAHFWLNLILSLMYGGIVFGFPFLIALPVIHALLVVLEVF